MERVLRIGLVRVLAWSLGTLAAHAADGVIEINQAKALAGGVTSSDSPGFPVTLTEPGSYVLTSDLDVRVASDPPNTTAIEVVAALSGAKQVEIDLNGFTILGPRECLVDCDETGSGIGVFAYRAVVRNGAVVGMGSHGVEIAGSGRIEGVTANRNGGAGLVVGWGGVRDCTAIDNASHGIQASPGAVVTRSVAGANGGDGIRGGLIESSVAVNNVGAGFVPARSLVDSVASGNTSQLACEVGCALGGNRFEDCSGAACLTGAGTKLQLPPASNMCGGVVCP